VRLLRALALTDAFCAISECKTEAHSALKYTT
jgi:hypothetical protein